MDYFKGLNPMQAEAARHIDGPLLILAGAGSGKTRVLVHRIAHLVDEAGVPPWAILAITFTNKAAREMKSRVGRMLPDASSAIWISTFHAACVRILRRDIERLGYQRAFSICDADDQATLIKQCLKELNISDKLIAPRAALEEIGHAKDAMQSPDEYGADVGSDFRRTKIARVYKLYQSKLRKNNTLDFDDIILLTVKLLREHEDVRDYYQTRFRHVLVDEYQDTNKAQYTLVMLLSGKWRNICVVGDDDQSIYGWRGANIGNILGFEKDFPDARVIKLEQNYRSTKAILDAANNVIKENTSRKLKRLWTENEDGARIGLVTAENEHEEAAYVAREVRQHKTENGLAWSDFAILYRMNAQSRALENTLIREGVPYRIVGGFKFFDRKEIKDIIAYLRLIQNPRDEMSFLRVINVPRRGIGEATVEKLTVVAQAIGDGASLFDAASALSGGSAASGAVAGIRGVAYKQIAEFVALINSLAREAETLGMDELLDRLLERTGIMKAYKADQSEESMARMENILELKSEILEFERNFISDAAYYADPAAAGEAGFGPAAASIEAGFGPAAASIEAGFGPAAAAVGDASFGSAAAAAAASEAGFGSTAAATVVSGPPAKLGLSEFLMHVTLMSDIDNMDEDDEKVSLMTMHSAKGLEFDNVFVVGAEEGIFPGVRAIADAKQLEEERRLCYVAMTRAKKRLCMTNATTRTLFGSTVCNRLSRFVSDIPDDLLDRNDNGAAVPWNGEAASSDAAHRDERHRRYASGAPPAPIAPRRRVYPSDRPGVAGRLPGPVNAFSSAMRATAAIHSGDTYAVGDAVRHKKYGVGKVSKRVQDESDYVIEVEFENAGMRRFIEAMVSLQRVE